jgi:predicted DNA-binding ribbon-helix-helix protein
MKRQEAGPDRVQTGVRMEKRLVKALKAIAEYYDLSLGDLLEHLVLSTFADRKLLSGAALALAVELSRVYGLDAAAYTPPVLEATETEGR